MSKDVFILGGARTPMTEYTGALKDISAEVLELTSRFPVPGVTQEAVRA